MYDASTVVSLVLAGLSLYWLAPSDRTLRRMLWGLCAAGVAVTIGTRLAWGAFAGSVAAVMSFCIVFGLAVVHTLVGRRQWPARAMGLALCVLTSVAAFQRAMRFELVRNEPLYPDVQYYWQQAARTWSPFAAGNKTPLWSALNAPLVRLYPDDPGVMRVLSCCAGIAVIPLMAFVIGRFLGNVVGVIVAGLCALDTWMIDLCCQGLREEANLILWLLFFMVAFRSTTKGYLCSTIRAPTVEAMGHPSAQRTLPPASRSGWLSAGVLGGLLLLLRNTNVPALAVMLLYATLIRRWRGWRGIAAIVLPLAIVSPFYVNQWRQYGDAFHLERRDARYYVNGEFGNRRVEPARPISMPSPDERARDPYAGEPVSPFDYLFRLRPLRAALYGQGFGITRALLGYPYGWGPPLEWFALTCAAGMIGLLILPVRWMPLFWVASIAGMQAHLIAIHMLEQRMILQSYPFWLAGGVALLCAGIARGLAAWKAGGANVSPSS